MANDVTIDLEIDAPAQTVFDYLADWQNASSYVYGLEHLAPLTETTRGLGATFEGKVKMGATLAASIEVIEFVEGERFATESFKGVKNAMRWTVAPLGDDRSRVNLVWTFDFGGGLTGKVLDKAVQPFVKIAAKHSAAELKAGIERQA